MKALKKVSKSYIFTILLTSLIFVTTMITQKFYPFGERSLLVWDGNDQYLNFYGYLRSSITGKENLLYSFSNVLGGNMFSLSAYYLLSPYFLLFALFPTEQLILAVHVVALLKYISAALTFCVLLNAYYENRNIEKALFSACYSFIGYTTAYFMILPWFEGVILLPLIALGVHRLVRDKKCGLYILSLASAIITNYYIGYMLCITSVLFYLAEMVVSEIGIKKCLRKTWYRFGLSSLLAGGLSSVILLPVIMSARTERIRSGISESMHFQFNFEFGDFFAKFFTGSTDASQMKNGLPIVFFGIVPLILLILYFLNKEIRYLHKVAAALLLLIFLLSFQGSTLNIFWHGMTDNICFNYRYSFVFSFVCLLLAFSSLFHIKQLQPEAFGKCGFIFFLLFIVVFNKSKEFIPIWALYLDIFWIVVALIFLACYYKGINPGYYYIGLAALLMLNVLINNAITLKCILLRYGSAEQTEYSTFYSKTSELLQKIPEEQLVRVEKNFRRTACDNMLLGIKGVSNYASTESVESLQFAKDIGMRQTWMECGYNPDSPVSADSLIGIKYLLSDNELRNKDYVLLAQDDGYYVYQNPYSLSLIMPTERLENEIPDTLDSFERMNLYWKSLAPGIKENVFKQQEISKLPETTGVPGHMKIQMHGETDSVLYLFAPAGAYEIKTDIDGEAVEIENSGIQAVYCIGKVNAGCTVQVEIIGKEDCVLDKDQIKIYAEDENIIKAYVKQVDRAGVNLYEINSSHLRGSYTAGDKDGYVVTTIPYDIGWSVYVDGEKTATVKNWDAMLAFQTSEGKHSITMKYFPAGLKEGMIITVISSVLFLLYLLGPRWRKRISFYVRVGKGIVL